MLRRVPPLKHVEEPQASARGGSTIPQYFGFHEITLMPMDFKKIPSPCYVIDEHLLRNNLALIRKVKDAAGVEILVSFKAFSNWGVFPIFKEYGFGASASSLNEARLAFEELGVKA